jgi:hypothetical protein
MSEEIYDLEKCNNLQVLSLNFNQIEKFNINLLYLVELNLNSNRLN